MVMPEQIPHDGPHFVVTNPNDSTLRHQSAATGTMDRLDLHPSPDAGLQRRPQFGIEINLGLRIAHHGCEGIAFRLIIHCCG